MGPWIWPGKRGGSGILDHRQHLVKLFVQVLDGLKLPAPKKRRGRRFKYAWLTILKCGLVMVYYRLSGLRSLGRFLHQHPSVAAACGLAEEIPSYRTFGRRFKRLEDPVGAVVLQLLRRLVKRRWIRWTILATDASLLAAKGRAPKAQRPDGQTSDREAAWGYSASDDSWVWGYKLHAMGTVRPCLAPVAWRTTTANVNEGRHLPVVLDRLPPTRRGRPACLGDTAYDSRRNVRACRQHRLRLITPLKGNRWPRSHMATDRQRRLRLYRRWMRKRRFTRLRADIERLFGQLKDVFLLDPLPIKGLVNVQSYVSLVMLAYLAGVAYNGSVHRGLRALKSLVA